ncbi:MAG: hypothetical protein OXC05_10175 [Halieaceae bacterium]|nr:hypothetical protein [Halieaceae bacterium]
MHWYEYLPGFTLTILFLTGLHRLMEWLADGLGGGLIGVALLVMSVAMLYCGVMFFVVLLYILSGGR